MNQTRLEEQDLDFVLDEMDRLGGDITEEDFDKWFLEMKWIL